jgi:DNA-directed RNA polymerase
VNLEIEAEEDAARPTLFVPPRQVDPPPTEAQIERQIHWEHDAIEAGIRRYRAAVNAPGRELVDTSPGQRLIRKILDDFVLILDCYKSAVETKGLEAGRGRRPEYERLILKLPSDVLAYLTLRAVMPERPTSKDHLRVLRKCAFTLAASVEQEFAYRDWLEEEKGKRRAARQRGQSYPDLPAALRRKAKKVDARSFRRYMRWLDRPWRQGWDRNTKIQLAHALIERLLMESSGGWFEIRPASRGSLENGTFETPWVIELSEGALKLLEDQQARAEFLNPPHRPMLCRPAPWRWDVALGQYVGGYYHLTSELIHASKHQHTAALPDPLSPETISAINAIQNTPWRVNRRVFEVMQRVSEYPAGFAGFVPRAEDEPQPARFPEASWKKMSTAERAPYLAKMAEIHSRNAKRAGKRYAWRMRLDVAKQVVDELAIWFPYYCDFRGRIYALVSDLSPQDNDAAKGLLEFAHGKPLGPLGLHWLCVRAANCYGKDGADKAPHYDQVRWVEENMELAHRTADDPLEFTWWADDTEDPWCLLATLFEISAAMRSPDAHEFVSHLPIPQDGTCNGLQHLSALGRDQEGALATNVITERGVRRDVYAEVAQRVLRQVTVAAGFGEDEMAAKWLEKGIERATVKRGVLTTAYGVSDHGMAKQLRDDGFAEDAEEANYLRDRIQNALEQTILSAKQIRVWCEELAGTLAQHNIPFKWQTPTGNTLVMSNWKLKNSRITTLMGEIALPDRTVGKQRRTLQLQDEAPEKGLDRGKQRRSACANVVHSFDAAHLCRVVNAGAAAGLADFAVVHDSFSVHAADTSRLNDILCMEFAKIYAETNWLDELENYVRSYAPDVALPAWSEYVTLGDLEIFPDVMRSEPFFS